MKSLFVQKFGGTSVSTQDRMRKIGRQIQHQVSHSKCVVVLSAMGNATNLLLQEAKKRNISTAKKIDAWISEGENRSVSIFQDILSELGLASIVMNAFDIPLRTNADFGHALIENVNPEAIIKNLSKVDVVIVPGFQGVCGEDITTLGRGGSDLTAVALSVSLGARMCEIYTDVPGIMTTDPKIEPAARVLEQISFDEMITMSYAGAKVLQARCVILAKRYQMPICVRSSFEKTKGTMVVKESRMENVIVSGIALAQTQLHIVLCYDKENHNQVVRVLSECNLKVLYIKNHARNVRVELLVDKDESQQFLAWGEGAGRDILVEQNIVSVVTVVGTGLMVQKEVFFDIQELLFREDIDLLSSTLADGKICLIVPERKGEKTVRVIHSHYGLEKEPN